MRFGVLSLVVGTVAIAGACNNGSPGSEGETSTSAVPTRPSVAVSVPPPSEQFNQGRSEVEFDPCFDVGDDTIIETGFNPKTREREDFVSDNYTFLSCNFSAKDPGTGLSARFLTLNSSNITVQEFRDRHTDAQDVTVSGRDAVVFEQLGACWLAMESPDGTFSLQLDTPEIRKKTQPCDSTVNVAKIIEPSLDGE